MPGAVSGDAFTAKSPFAQKTQILVKFTDFPTSSCKWLKIAQLPHILALWGGRGTQKHLQNLTFNKGIHPGGAKGQPLHQKVVILMEFT